MALLVNTKAPDFTLPSTSGKDFNLYTHAAGKPIVIYFYPKDFTTGCTTEACSFRDHFETFKQLNTLVVGISKDDLATHAAFKKEFNLPFELLSDTHHSVAKAYDAYIPLINFTRRITYLLDGQQRIVAVYENLINAKKHIEQMLAGLQKTAVLTR